MIDLIKGSETYSLDDGSNFFLIGDNGWGFPKIVRLNEKGPQQHGETDIGFRIQKRTGTVALQIIGNSRANMYSKRRLLEDILSPSNSPLKLRWTFEDGVKRQIDGHAVTLDFSSDGRQGFSQKTIFSLECPEGVFYNPVESTATFSLGGGSDSLEIPMSVPHTVGSSVLDSTKTLTTLGNWKTFPHRLRVNGPITNPIIENESTGKTISFNGQTIPSGEYWELDLRYGYKTVVDSSGANKIDKLTSGSDLSEWALESKSVVDGGNNLVRITGSSITEETQVSFGWFDKYLGI